MSPPISAPWPSTPFCPSSSGEGKTMQQPAPVSFGTAFAQDQATWAHVTLYLLPPSPHTGPLTRLPGLLHTQEKRGREEKSRVRGDPANLNSKRHGRSNFKNLTHWISSRGRGSCSHPEDPPPSCGDPLDSVFPPEKLVRLKQNTQSPRLSSPTAAGFCV